MLFSMTTLWTRSLPVKTLLKVPAPSPMLCVISWVIVLVLENVESMANALVLMLPTLAWNGKEPTALCNPTALTVSSSLPLSPTLRRFTSNLPDLSGGVSTLKVLLPDLCLSLLQTLQFPWMFTFPSVLTTPPLNMNTTSWWKTWSVISLWTLMTFPSTLVLILGSQLPSTSKASSSKPTLC